jgi:hypothetical protein
MPDLSTYLAGLAGGAVNHMALTGVTDPKAILVSVFVRFGPVQLSLQQLRMLLAARNW